METGLAIPACESSRMNGFFREYIESHHGDVGDFYMEVKDGSIVRHVSVFKGVYYWATPLDCFDSEYDFTSRPEFNQQEETAIQIVEIEFQRIWKIALSQIRTTE